MRRLLSLMGRVVWSGVMGLIITFIGSATWGVLLTVNLRTSPAVPWSVVPMALALWLMARYVTGKGWPGSTSNAQVRDLRARPISFQMFAWSMLAGSLAIVALAGYWIVFFQFVSMRPNLFSDYSPYPWLTVALIILMGSLVSPLTEEAGFRGYCQVRLEREFRAPAAVALSSFFFMLAHLNQGLFWPKLLVYYLVGLTFGAIAYLANSIQASIPVHILGDLIFFILIWPHDAARRLVWEGGADAWFWVHVAQAVVFTGLSILAFRGLARVSETVRVGRSNRIPASAASATAG
ncbi:MAG TPA: CPBP family intramembrane glutamic endopeptidase [Terriglobia bacterium]|nr:CPBP family intramembrane glutamic endopeptidase [Terriglobia bacterium]